MAGSLIIVVFGATFLIALGLIYALSGGQMVVSERLGRLWSIPRRNREEVAATKQTPQEFAGKVLTGIARYIPGASDRPLEGDPKLIMAGFRRPEAASAFTAARVVTIVAMVGLVYFTGFYKNSPFFAILGSIMAGFILPDFWLGRKIRNRQQTLRLALPDTLDLLVICMEAGLGIDQALLYISQELRVAHPAICEEFDMVNAEMHVGKTRIEALRSFATRTGVDDIQALVSTLIQTDRFGTSVAQSMRVHSDELRTKRRQRAEEMAAKTTIKMIFPLVLFIFPALFIVILGPAMITMMHTLANMNNR
jgi:tight adherence protein C